MEFYGWNLTDLEDALERDPAIVGQTIAYIAAKNEFQKEMVESNQPNIESPDDLHTPKAERWMSKRRMEARSNEAMLKQVFGSGI